MLTSLGIVIIRRHGRSSSPTLTDIIPHKHKLATRCLKVLHSTIVTLVTGPKLHVTIVVSIKITLHNNLVTLIIYSLTHPRHRSASLVEPRVCIVGAATELAANIIVEVETMMTVLGGRTAGAGARGPILVREEVTGSRRFQKSMAHHE